MKNRNLLGANGFNRCVPGREGYLVYNDNDEYVGHSVAGSTKPPKPLP